jgi:colanic acid/amylovoran biosynthesis glycosyltransferase
MFHANAGRIGYVLKMFPRFSETFILHEILAHEAAGAELEIFSLRAPTDGRFHEALARVRAPVHYLPYHDLKLATFWAEVERTAQVLPDSWPALQEGLCEDVRDVYQALLLAQNVRARAITHLHAHFASVATTVTRLAARFAGIPFSFTAHAKDLYHESVQPEDLRRKLQDAATVITVSDYNVAFLQENYGPAAEQVRRIYNGIDLEEFGYHPPLDRPTQVLAVGRLIEKKGFDDLIAACAMLRQRGRDVECTIVGAGPLEADLASQIERLGLADRVRLIGPRPQGDVCALMREAAVFAAPCIIGADGNRDGLPTVLLEAMALGTPCISTDVTGIPEVLADGETGLMVPQHDPVALADAIERLLDDPALCLRLSENARFRVEQSFDLAANTEQIRAVFAGDAVLQQHEESVR